MFGFLHSMKSDIDMKKFLGVTTVTKVTYITDGLIHRVTYDVSLTYQIQKKPRDFFV